MVSPLASEKAYINKAGISVVTSFNEVSDSYTILSLINTNHYPVDVNPRTNVANFTPIEESPINEPHVNHLSSSSFHGPISELLSTFELDHLHISERRPLEDLIWEFKDIFYD